MPALSLDIGSYTIKALSGQTGDQVEIEKAVEIFNSVGVAIPNDDGVQQKLTELIETLFNDHKLPRSDVRLSLPETVVSTKVIELPSLSDAELASAIGWQAEQHIPIPPEQLSLEYHVLFRPTKKAQEEQKMRVMLVGTRRDIVERYIDIFLGLGIEPKVLETQALSIMRALAIEPAEPPTLVVHLGASSSQLAMIHQGELQFVTSHMSGGQALTQVLEKQINLETQQAEEYKRTYGLLADQFQGKVRTVLEPTVDALLNEMKKATTYFANQHPDTSVQRVILSGGASLLPDLVQYITQEMGLEVLMAAPFANASGQIPQGGHPAWTVCMGLMMREEQ